MLPIAVQFFKSVEEYTAQVVAAAPLAVKAKLPEVTDCCANAGTLPSMGE
jgi:hypothetical protein